MPVRGQWQIIGQSARSVPALGVAVAAGIKADYISQILEESVVHKGLALCHAASSSPFGWMRTNGKASAGCGFWWKVRRSKQTQRATVGLPGGAVRSSVRVCKQLTRSATFPALSKGAEPGG